MCMITVQDSLRLPALQNVIVRSGKSGLARKIRWVHIIDHDDVAHFLEGQEFLLSCGQVWPKDRNSEDKFLDSLLRHQISGILLATGRYIAKCPPALLEFGEKYSIPVLEVPFQVPFVKLTYAIQQEIMERQYTKKIVADQVPSMLSEQMQTARDIKDICAILTDHLKHPVILTDETNAILTKAIPQGDKRTKDTQTIQAFINQINPEWPPNPKQHISMEHAITVHTEHPNVSTVPLNIDETGFRTLWILHNDGLLPVHHIPVLKLAAHVLIDMYKQEQEENVKRWQYQSEVLDLLLQKQQTATLVVEKKIQEIGLQSKGKWMAGLVLSGNIHLSPRTLLELASIRGVCNNWFEEECEIDGFCEVFGDRLVLLMTTSLKNPELKKRLEHLSRLLLRVNDQISPVFVIGSVQQDLLLFDASFESAKALAPIVQYKNHSGGTYFSDQFRREILLYGNMSPAEAHHLLTKLLPDKVLFEEGEILYETLKCLASNSYNRDIVAKKLHIHRNTLRYRIKKIEELLQDSLSSPDCQFWIQTALHIQSISHQHKL